MSVGIRVRFAPSPTGHLHVGGARTALFNWLFARHHQGAFILRIEDTDSERSRPEYTQAILEGLSWLGIDWDEGPVLNEKHGHEQGADGFAHRLAVRDEDQAAGQASDQAPGQAPFFQSQRLPWYRRAIEQLLAAGKLYHCFCSADRLSVLRAQQAEARDHQRYDGHCRNLSADQVNDNIARGRPFVLRLKRNIDETIVWQDLTKGEMRFQAELLDDLILVKSDGMPTYNLAVVVDDVAMGITHVIRGEDHLSNTPKQIMIYRALNARLPEFSHIPMILGGDRSRLSKRHGATSVIDYQRQGFLPAALRNYLALLGWAPETGVEIMSVAEMVSRFTLDKVSASGSIFDMEKLRWMNTEYLKSLDSPALLAVADPWLAECPGYPGDYDVAARTRIASLFRERVKTLDELPEQAAWFFQSPTVYDLVGLEKARKTDHLRELLSASMEVLAHIPTWQENILEESLRKLAQEQGVAAGKLIHPLRLALTGRTATPGIFEILAILGRCTCQERLQRFVDTCCND